MMIVKKYLSPRSAKPQIADVISFNASYSRILLLPITIETGKTSMNRLINARTAAIAAIVSSSLLTGCASIVNGTNQVVSVDVRNKGEIVSGATCKLENDKGVFYVTTPGTVTVHRAYNDLTVKCQKENMPSGVTTSKSSTKGMAYGNILFGGIIGIIVDMNDGAAYDYPSVISVLMGEDAQVAPIQVSTAAPAAPASQATPPVVTK
jgi:hypothetical protein